VDQKEVEVMVLLKDSVESKESKTGAYFYAHNFLKNKYFLILVSGSKEGDGKLPPEILASGLKQVFGESNVKIKDSTAVEIPDSSILLVGNVEKNEFVKIQAGEKIGDVKKRLDPLLALGNSLLFRKNAFKGDGFDNVNDKSLLPGDVVIAPERNYFSCGDNFHRLNKTSATPADGH